MLAPRYLDAESLEWNRKWGAPFGYPNAERVRSLDDIPFVHRARLAGPFAFQANNTPREYEYPFAFSQIDHTRQQAIVDVGAGITGFQFVLAKHGHRVYCVDPGLDDRANYGWGSHQVTHQDLNSAFHTDVEPLPVLLENAKFAPGSIDYVVCISTIEHVSFEGSAALLKAAGDFLRIGGRMVATVDLFLDLKPFTKRTQNRWGTNLNLSELFATDSRFKLVVGEPSQLYGCEGFSAATIQQNCADYYIGLYPCFAQCFVLEKVSD